MALGLRDGRVAFALRPQNSGGLRPLRLRHDGPPLALRLHLLGHRVLDLNRGLDVFQLPPVDFHPPLVGGFVEHIAQFDIHRLPGGECFIQRQLAHDVSQGGPW